MKREDEVGPLIHESGMGSGAIWDGLGRLAVLPEWLTAATQPERVRAALAAVVPELAAGDCVLRECVPERLRLKSEAWTVTYRATVSGEGEHWRDVCLGGRLCAPGQARPGRAASAGAFGSDDWRGVVPDLGLDLHTEASDDALPALSRLTDPDQARVLLEEAIRTCSPYADFGVAGCTPVVARYSRGSRCTVVYKLDYPPETRNRPWPAVVAKAYRGDKGRNAYTAMHKLWGSDLGRSKVVALAEPLAYLPDLRVLVQSAIPGDQTLKELIRSTLSRGTAEALRELDDIVAKTAEGLAALHDSGINHGEVASLDDELADVHRLVTRLAGPIPGVADAATPWLARITSLAARHPSDSFRPAHRSFRPAQVLVDERGIGFIDFDGYCQAEPALDIAQFCASVRSDGISPAGTGSTPPSTSAMEADLSVLDHVCERFRSCYEAILPVSRVRVMLWETLHMLTSVLHAWTKAQPAFLPGRMLILERHLRAAGLRS
ncbi:MAG: phosphotransferase [Acidimicrobiales bacterium]